MTNRFCAAKLHLGAGEAGAGAGGHAAGATERAIVGLVTGDVQFQKRARRDIQFQATAATVNDCSGSHGEAAFLFDHAYRFAGRAARGPHVFDHQNAFAGFQFESAAQSHLAGAIAFDEKRANANARATSWPMTTPPSAGETTQATE